MNRKWCAVALLLLLPACATLPKPKAETLSAENAPLITRKVLDNGLTVLLKEVHRTPVVSILAYVKTGSAREGVWTGSGISHALEHMLFKGTETRGVGEIEKQIGLYGGDMNAFTTHDVTGYTVVVSRDHYLEALDLLADSLMHARLDASEFEKEKEVIRGEIRLNQDNPFRRLSDLLWQNAYHNHPYRYPVIGYESLLKKLTDEELVHYYHEKYVANNTILVLVGDFETQEALEAVQKHFRQFERRSLPPAPQWSEPMPSGTRKIREEAPVQLAHLAMGYYTVSVTDKDMYPLDVLAILLGEGENSRLTELLQKKQQLVYAVESSHYTPLDPGLFTITAVLEEEKIPAVLSTIRREIEKIKQDGVGGEELEKAKQHVLSSYYFGQETVQSQANDLAENEAFGLDPLFSKQYVKAIASVTPEEVKRVATQYLTEKNLTLVTLVPEAPREKKEDQKPTPAKAPGNIEKLTLPNGVRVLLQKDTAQPTVSLGVALLGGLRFEVETSEGISNFVSRMLPKGTTARSEKEISDWLDSKGASFTPFSGQNSFGLRLKMLKGDVGEGIQFLKELVASPTFPQEELEKERKQILGEIKAENDEIFKVGERLLRRTLYTQHPYRFYPLGREATISHLMRQDLVSFYQHLLAPESMVITVFGDIEPDKVVGEIQKNFSNLKRKEYKTLDLSQEPPLQEVRSVIQKLPKEQALLLVGFHGISLKDEDYYVFEVLTGILSGGGGKLYSEIRDKKGQAYTLGGYSVWGLDPGFYVFYVATTPEEVPSVQEKLFSEIESLRHIPIPVQEIERAKESLIGLHRIALQTPDALSFQAALDELYGLGFNRYLHYEEKIRAVTALDLKRVASTYFDPDKKGVILMLPEHAKEKQK